VKVTTLPGDLLRLLAIPTPSRLQKM